jgi:hypothetical protein
VALTAALQLFESSPENSVSIHARVEQAPQAPEAPERLSDLEVAVREPPLFDSGPRVVWGRIIVG